MMKISYDEDFFLNRNGVIMQIHAYIVSENPQTIENGNQSPA